MTLVRAVGIYLVQGDHDTAVRGCDSDGTPAPGCPAVIPPRRLRGIPGSVLAIRLAP